MRFPAASGIAIAPILFVIALLAILATAIASATSSFSGGTDQEKARVFASEMMAYADTVAAAVQRVTALGCSETQISFENSFVSGYTNSNAPADYHCHIFHPLGGGMTYQLPPSSVVYNTTYGYWQFLTGTTTLSLLGIGTSKNDLWLVLKGSIVNASNDVNIAGQSLLAACKKINEMVGVQPDTGTVTNLPSLISSAPQVTEFAGTYPDCSTTQDVSAIKYKTKFCVQVSGGEIRYMTLLISR